LEKTGIGRPTLKIGQIDRELKQFLACVIQSTFCYL